MSKQTMITVITPNKNAKNTSYLNIRDITKEDQEQSNIFRNHVLLVLYLVSRL